MELRKCLERLARYTDWALGKVPLLLLHLTRHKQLELLIKKSFFVPLLILGMVSKAMQRRAITKCGIYLIDHDNKAKIWIENWIMELRLDWYLVKSCSWFLTTRITCAYGRGRGGGNIPLGLRISPEQQQAPSMLPPHLSALGASTNDTGICAYFSFPSLCHFSP